MLYWSALELVCKVLKSKVASEKGGIEGIEPSVAPRAPSVTAHPLQGCCSRCKHLQTQAMLPEAAPIHHLSLLTLHTHNVVPGLIHCIEVFPPKTGPMCCAASNKASPSAR